MVFNVEMLEKAAILGSLEASKAFSKLSSEKVTVFFSEVDFVSAEKVHSAIELNKESIPVVAYAQMFTGVDGLSILSMTREESLNFIDLLNNKPIGTTGVLMDIDRSAIKETLNIISNSFLNSLAKNANITLFYSEPHLITTSSLLDILNKLDKTNDDLILFKTKLEIAQHNISAQLYLLFNAELSNVLNNI